jgi:hypothetical protein
MNFWRPSDSLFPKAFRKSVSFLPIPDRHEFRAIPLDLPNEFVQVATRCQRHHAKARRKRIHHRQALTANRTRRTKNGKLLHEGKIPL